MHAERCVSVAAVKAYRCRMFSCRLANWIVGNQEGLPLSFEVPEGCSVPSVLFERDVGLGRPPFPLSAPLAWRRMAGTREE